MRKFKANREFTKNIRHNGKNYILRSIFDTDTKFDFDAAVARYNRKQGRYNFDAALQQFYHEQYEIHDQLDDLYKADIDIFN